MPDGSPDYNLYQYLEGEAPQLQLMLQALLAERFNLKVHRETRQLPVYALTVGKRGPKLKTAAEPEMIQFPDGSLRKNRSLLWTPALEPNGERSDRALQMIVRDRSLQELADTLSMFMDRPVLDQTGIKGHFDI